VLSNNATDVTNDLDVTAGAAASDATTPALITLASAITKRLDANWAVGTGNGGLDTGTKAVSTVYYVWLIQRSDTSVVDVLASLSDTAPTMPASYDRKRRIGAICTNSAGGIREFVQDGDDFTLKTLYEGVNVTNLGTTAVLYTLVAPANVLLTAHAYCDHASLRSYIAISDPDTTDFAPGSYNGSIIMSAAAAGTNNIIPVRTNSSRQIRARSNDTSVTFRFNVRSWTDTRGRNA
jgi:hypothetical protein